MKARHAKKLLTAAMSAKPEPPTTPAPAPAPPPAFILPASIQLIAPTPMLEDVVSFSMNLQCETYDARMKYQKVDFFESQKVFAMTVEELEEKKELAYARVKKTVLRRMGELAGEIYAHRDEAYPFPIQSGGTHPVAKGNARAFEEWQAGRMPRNHAKALEEPARNMEVVNE